MNLADVLNFRENQKKKKKEDPLGDVRTSLLFPPVSLCHRKSTASVV